MHAAELLRDLLANGPFVRADAPYRLLPLRGPDAGEFLHRLCSQDVLGLGDGQVRPAAFLDSKGKLVATCHVVRLGAQFWLETQQDQAERLAALLERYHFTEKVTIGPLEPAGCHEWLQAGDAAPAAGTAELVDGRPLLRLSRRGVRVARWHGAAGAPTPAACGWPQQAASLDEARAEGVRLLAGLLRVGVETEATTLALEADLDDHISTTKGCYTGQEIVARIHTYGHTNRKACLLWLPAGPPITAPQPLHDEDGLAVGRVLHAVPVPGHAGRLGIGYLPKDFQALGTKLALAGGGVVEVIGYEPLAGLPA